MAFFPFTLPGPGQWSQRPQVTLTDPRFTLCTDPGQVHSHSLRVLEDQCRQHRDLTIAFSGGADSWFLVLCLHQLIREGRVAADRAQIWTGDYTLSGHSLTPDSDRHQWELSQLGFHLHRVVLAVEDPATQDLLIEQTHRTASHIHNQIAQYAVMSHFPGRVLIAEGGPTVMPPPWLEGEPRPRGTWAMLSALEYERDGRVLFHSLDRELWGSWLIRENVEFRQPAITQAQRSALSQEQRHLLDRLRYHWRYRLYSAGFPEHGDRFLWKKPSWLGLQDLPELARWHGYRHYHGDLRPRRELVRLSPGEQFWNQAGLYSHTWVPIQIQGD